MNKKPVLILGLIIIISLIVVYNPARASKAPQPTQTISDTAETRQIMQTINRAYNIEREIIRTLNLNQLDSVFINDPRYPMDPATLQTVREMTNNPQLEEAGFLDYKVAYYSWFIDGVKRREAVETKAKAENRALTNEEARSLIDEHGRVAPGRPGIEPQKDLPEIKFLSIVINEDVAIVKVDDGPRIVEYTLVFLDNHWYLANMEILMIDA